MALKLNKECSLALKGLAIIFVIFSHLGLFPCGGAIGVHIFLIVSGYGIYCTLEKSSDGYWIRRIKSVYLPYLFCTIIFVFIRMLVSKDKNISVLSLIITLLGLDFNLNVDMTMWYISYIFVCYGIAWGIFIVQDKSKILSIFFGSIMFFLITLCGYKHIIWHKGTIAWAYGFSFPLGMMIAKFKNCPPIISSYLKRGVAIICLLVCTLLLFLPHEKMVKFIFTFSSAVLIYTLINSYLLKRKKVILSKIGELSYFMYLNEAVLIEYFELYDGNVYTAIIVIVTSFVIAYIMNYIYLKILTNSSYIIKKW